MKIKYIFIDILIRNFLVPNEELSPLESVIYSIYGYLKAGNFLMSSLEEDQSPE